MGIAKRAGSLVLSVAVLATVLVAGPGLLPSPAVPTAGAVPGSQDLAAAPLICGGSGTLDGGYWVHGMPVGSRNAADQANEKYVRLWWPAGSTMSLTTNALQTDANGNGNMQHGIRELDGTRFDSANVLWPYSHPSNYAFSAGPATWVNNGPSRYVYVFTEIWMAVNIQEIRWSVDVSVSSTAGDDRTDCAPLSESEFFGPNPSLKNCPNAEPVKIECGDPVNTDTGNLHMPLPGLGVLGRGPGLAWEVGYNSLAASSTSPAGNGWSHSYGMRLTEESDGTMLLHQETGATVRFFPDGSDWRAPSRATATLVEHPDGSFTVTRRHVEVFDFDASGRLSAIADLHGNTTTLSYTGSELDHVEDSAGRRMGFTWSDGRITEVSAPGLDASTPQVVSMTYEPDGDLATYTDTGGGVWSFTYDGENRMLTMRKPANQGGAPGAVVENHYDAQGRVEWQDDELDNRTAFAYGSSGGVAGPEVRYVSDMAWTSETNGHGPAERDMSNGEDAAGDGSPLAIGPLLFTKGVGVHANSDITMDTGGDCSTFEAVVGIDNVSRERDDGLASVQFTVLGDGVALWSSPVLTSASAPLEVSVPMMGVSSLTLSVSDGGDGVWFDHADWADARLICGSAAIGTTRYVSDLPWTSETNGYGPAERDMSNGEDGAGDGGPISIDGEMFAKGMGVHATSELTLSTGGDCDTFLAVVGVDDEIRFQNGSSVVFSVLGDGVELFASPVLDSAAAPLPVSVDVTGVSTVTLRVTDGGDNEWFDHADWGDARLICGDEEPDPATTRTTVTGADGRATIFTYEDGMATGVTVAAGTPLEATWSYTFDRASLGVIREEDPNGHVASHEYDGAGNRVRTTVAGEVRHSAEFGPLDLPVWVEDGEGVRTAYSWDTTNGRLLSVTQNSTSMDGDAPRTTSLAYGDPSHPEDVTAVTDPTSKVWGFTYDADTGDRVSETDPLGNETSYGFNGAGWLTSVVSPKGNAPGGVPADHTMTFAHDTAGRTVSLTDAEGGVTERHYSAGLLRWEDDPADNRTSYTYDDALRLVATTRSDTSTLLAEYWGDGSLKTRWDAAGEPTAYSYDDAGRLATSTDPLGRVTTYGHDAEGRRTFVQAHGGNCTATPIHRCTTYTYDDLDQVTAVTHSDDDGITTPDVTGITYDGVGRRTQMTDGTGTSAWDWNAFGELEATTAGNGDVVSYTYDARGLQDSITYPGNATVTRSFDDAGRWTGLTDWLGGTGGFGYDENSNLEQIIYPAGTGNVDTFSFDDANRLSGITYTHGATTLGSIDYTRDDNGRVATADATGLPGVDESYGYSPLDQLEQINTTVLDYDTADNLVVRSDGTTQAFDQANQLCWTSPTAATGSCDSAPADATGFAYDTSGNRTNEVHPDGSSRQLTYDSVSRLVGVADRGPGGIPVPGAPDTTYAYDGDGYRSTKSRAGEDATQFTWDRSDPIPKLLTQRTGTGERTHVIYGPGGHAYAQITGTDIAYYHRDQLGSTRLLTNNSGDPVGTYTYDPYGKLTASTGTTTPLLGFAGEYTDHETGFMYLRPRYYDPVTGQFLTRDPLEHATGDAYGYGGNNPTTNVDPTGLFFGAVGAAIGGVVGAATGAVSHVAEHGLSDVRGLVASTVGGAVGGAATGACVTTLGAAPVAGAVCSAAGSVAGGFVESLIAGRSYSRRDALVDGTIGAISSWGGSKLADRFGYRINRGWFKPEKPRHVVRPGAYASAMYAHEVAGASIAFTTGAALQLREALKC